MLPKYQDVRVAEKRSESSPSLQDRPSNQPEPQQGLIPHRLFLLRWSTLRFLEPGTSSEDTFHKIGRAHV